ELVGFPAGGELRVGPGVEPTIRVRANKWIVYDREAPDRWRAMRWSDLQRSEFLAGAVAALPDVLRGGSEDPTVDQVDLPLAPLDADRLAAVRQVMNQIDEFTKVEGITLRQPAAVEAADGNPPALPPRED